MGDRSGREGDIQEGGEREEGEWQTIKNVFLGLAEPVSSVLSILVSAK